MFENIGSVLGVYTPKPRNDMSRTNDLYQDELESAGIEIERLEAENKRYREALEFYAKYGQGMGVTGEIAQAALKDKGE